MFVPTRKLWPAATINSILGEGGAADLDRLKPVHEMAWCPGKEMIVRDKVVFEGGWLDKPGSNTFNTYMTPPVLEGGDAEKAQPWLDHVRKVYPDEADHLIEWLAHRMQFPEIKINHGLILSAATNTASAKTPFWSRWSAHLALGTSKMFRPHSLWIRNSIPFWSR